MIAPYPTFGNKDLITRIPQGERPHKPKCMTVNSLNEIYRVMTQCWDHDPNQRPSWEDLQKQISDLKGKQETNLELEMEYSREIK